MSNELHRLEESLKAFLSGGRNSRNNSSNTHKYNNLKILIEPSKYNTPNFIVRTGFSEAMYIIQTGEKVSGGLGSDERLVRRWIEGTFVKSDLNEAWDKAKKNKATSALDND